MEEPQARAPEAMSFGDAMSELESIVGALESGSLDLEESMGRYERGIGLLRDLQGRLRDAEHKVRVLVGELEAEESDEGGAAGA